MEMKLGYVEDMYICLSIMGHFKEIYKNVSQKVRLSNLWLMGQKLILTAENALQMFFHCTRHAGIILLKAFAGEV